LKYIFFILLISFRIFPQISPGDLTKAHAELEGISNCTKCHEIGEKVLSSKCLDCHTEIKSLLNANRGYHAYSEVKKRECASCHNEHHGRNFRIVNFNEDNFDHNKAGFKLTGVHSKKDCKDCHQSKFISDSNYKKKSKTYLGLNQKCASCHEDFHQGSLGTECGTCHSTEKFKPAANFDHNNTAFKLTGAHEKVECAKCHPTEKKNGKDFVKLNGLSFGNCSSCHTDVHKGAFGVDCKSCHSTVAFNIINQQNFDHNKTKFPLVGKHQSVKCNDCHKGAFKDKPLYAKCTDCHSDYHKEDFTKDETVTDCIICHSVQGFVPADFTIEDHNKSKFIIDGSHLAVACRQCHFKEENWKFKNVGLKCQECHTNVHGSEISEKFLPENKCESCHQTSNWETITFDHNSTDFVLLGKHQSVSCGNCHYREVNSKRLFKFISLTSDCEQCHKDIHFGQFRNDNVSDCTRCHGFDNWKAEKFDHSKAKFKNDGAHQKLECSKCHKTITQNVTPFVLYKIKEFKCIDCHSK
jgi:nitrate/TMAO reductase-like tetraheme cytochrome c subunit